MSIVCVLIGEGDSERYFVPSLLENKFGFESLTKTSAYIYKLNETYWLFPFPPAVCKTNGKKRLTSHTTYRKAGVILEGNLNLFSSKPEIIYLILHDLDGKDDQYRIRQEKIIMNAFKRSNVGYDKLQINFVNKEIECWYIAGISPTSKFLRRKISAKHKILNCDPEKIHRPKKLLEKVMNPRIKGAGAIAQRIGEDFNLTNAKKRSSSFSKFIEDLSNLKLL